MVDFAALAAQAQDGTQDDVTGSRDSKYSRSPLVPLVKDRQPHVLPSVETGALDEVKRELNGVAKALDMGIRIRPKSDGNGTYRVGFTGQDRKVIKRQPLTDEQKAARNAKREANKRAKEQAQGTANTNGGQSAKPAAPAPQKVAPGRTGASSRR